MTEVRNLELYDGDIIELCRNGFQYEFSHIEKTPKPRFFYAKCLHTKQVKLLSIRVKVKVIKSSEKVKVWYFTFGFGQPYEGCYHKIKGTKNSAEKQMYERFGEKWSMMYSAEEFKGQIEEYKLKEIK